MESRHKPLPLGLTLTHIFFGSPVERIGIVEFVKQSAIVLRPSGRFTESICKKWVILRPLGMGSLTLLKDVTLVSHFLFLK